MDNEISVSDSDIARSVVDDRQPFFKSEKGNLLTVKEKMSQKTH